MKLGEINLSLFLCWSLVLPEKILAYPEDPEETDNDKITQQSTTEDYDYDTDVSETDDGLYLGAQCKGNCSHRLLHAFCNPTSGVCECEKNYPVKLSSHQGCRKPKRLGDQCFYKETCRYSDEHSSCIQVHHNAVCQCERGYHSVSIQKPSRRVFCAEDVEVMTTNFSTFLGVLLGIALLSGLICFVLHLFNQNMYGPRRHRFANAHLAPSILFSGEQRSRRPSVTSIHSSNSVRSYSARRYEREREQKEEREAQKRLARISSVSDVSGNALCMPRPHSSDNLFTLHENSKQVPPLAIREESSFSFHEDMPSTSKQHM